MSMSGSNDEMGAHIFNVYEALDKPISMIFNLINSSLRGKLVDVQEKLDGQNITFTVINSKVHMFSKGVGLNRLRQAIDGTNPGLNHRSIKTNYANSPKIMKTYLEAYNALSKIVKIDNSLAEKVFQNGFVTVAALLMHPDNPNTIIYDKPTLVFVEAVCHNHLLSVDKKSYKEFSDRTLIIGDNLEVRPVPILRFFENKDYNHQINELSSELSRILHIYSLNNENTIGDLISSMVEYNLDRYAFISGGMKKSAAQRLVYKDKKVLTYKMFNTKDNWKEFQQLEKDNIVVMESIQKFEQVIQKLGTYLFRCYDFKLCSNDPLSGQALKDTSLKYQSAYDEGRIECTDVQLRRIESTLKRTISKLDYFEKQVEGIVFMFDGNWYKLTGMFTAINKLHGYFKFSNPATIKG